MSSIRTPVAVLVLVVVVAALVGGSFGLLDFGASESATDVQFELSTAFANETALDLSRGVYVHVAGDTVADREFEAALLADLRARGVDAVALPDLPERADRPVLVVARGEWTLGYTPVRGDATVAWRSLYVQSGDLSQFGRSAPGADGFSADRLTERLATEGFETVVFTADDLVSEGSFTVADETTGLLSLPNYDRHVRTVAATTTVDALFEATA